MIIDTVPRGDFLIIPVIQGTGFGTHWIGGNKLDVRYLLRDI